MSALSMALASQDEARDVAFGLAHLERHAAHEPALLDRLAAAVERRHDALARGHAAVLTLTREMDEGRRQRLERLGFGAARAEALSALHTRNFM